MPGTAHGAEAGGEPWGWTLAASAAPGIALAGAVYLLLRKQLSVSAARSARSAEELDGYRALVERLTVAVLEVDSTGSVVSANKAAREMFGSETLREVPLEGEDDSLSELMEKAMGGEEASGATLLETASGGKTRMRARAVPLLRDARPGGYLLELSSCGEKDTTVKELEKARTEAERTSEELKDTVRDLEEFALMAVRRELKMQEIRKRVTSLGQRTSGAGHLEEKTAEGGYTGSRTN